MLWLWSSGLRRGILRRCVRFNSISTTPNQKPMGYTQRASSIKEDHQKFYPLLKETRRPNIEVLRIPEFRARFEDYEFSPETRRIDTLFTVEGKISSIRKAGKAMYFLDIEQDGSKIQVIASNGLLNLSKSDFSDVHEILRKGDYISCVGYPGTTKVGELSIKVSEPISIVSAALNPLPPKLVDRSIIHQNRVLDYLVNKSSKDLILSRSIITAAIRAFLNRKGFLEVQTPIISSASKGANATPFVTTSSAIKNKEGRPVDLHLRVAPELWLKRLVIGGFEKVFEIGSVFRNEGIDATHNPEFTTCEFYQSFTTLEDLMLLTEDMFQFIISELKTKKLEVNRVPIELLEKSILESSGFEKLEFIPTIEKQTGMQLPDVLDTPNLLEFYQRVQLSPPLIKSPAQLLDGLCSAFIEPLCGSCPTFIYHQPSALSPLAKSFDCEYESRKFSISRRFELFINGREYVNAYEEENNPFEQNNKFILQQIAKDKYNDEESLVPDAKYLEAMELALPPTGGWGIGIDRLAMLLTESERIGKVLSFGLLSDVMKQ